MKIYCDMKDCIWCKENAPLSIGICENDEVEIGFNPQTNEPKCWSYEKEKDSQ